MTHSGYTDVVVCVRSGSLRGECSHHDTSDETREEADPTLDMGFFARAGDLMPGRHVHKR